MTLLGTVCSVLSPAFNWVYDPPRTSTLLAAVYIQRYTGNAYFRSGFELRIGWIVLLCGVVCGCLLLLSPSGRERRIYLTVQTVLGLTVVALAVVHLGPYAGIILAVVGGALLVGGGVARYGRGPAELHRT